MLYYSNSKEPRKPYSNSYIRPLHYIVVFGEGAKAAKDALNLKRMMV